MTHRRRRGGGVPADRRLHRSGVGHAGDRHAAHACAARRSASTPRSTSITVDGRRVHAPSTPRPATTIECEMRRQRRRHVGHGGRPHGRRARAGGRGRAPVPAERADRRLHAGRARPHADDARPRPPRLLQARRARSAGRRLRARHDRRSASTAASRRRSGASCSTPNFDRFAQLAELATKRTPVLEQAGIRTLVNGPIPYSADADFVMGRAPELDNFYVATGFLYGIAAGGGAGKMMAEWILEGRPSLDLWPLDVRRFSFHHTTRHFIGPRMVELYGHHYKLAAPGSEQVTRARRAAQPAARPARGGRRGVRLARRMGAAELVRAAGRRRRSTSRRSPAATGSSTSARGTRAVRNGVGADRPDRRSPSSRSPGPARCDAVQWLSVADMDKSVGTDHLHPAVQRAGRHRVRPDDGPHRAPTPGTSSPAPPSAPTTWAGSGRTARPTAASRSATSRRRARVDQPVRPARPRRAAGGVRGGRVATPPSATAGHVRSRSGRRRCWRCASATSASSAGSCTSRPSTPPTSTRCCGRPASRTAIADVGYRAIDTLRMEKGYLYWSTDVTPDTTPLGGRARLARQLGQGRLLRARRARRAARRTASTAGCARSRSSRRAWRLPGRRRGDHRSATTSSGSRRAPTSATRSASRSPTATCRVEHLDRTDFVIEVYGEADPGDPPRRRALRPEAERGCGRERHE